MAEKQIFSSIIDAFLSDREPAWDELDLADAKKSGDEQLRRTHKLIDTFAEDLVEGAHTQLPAGGKGKKMSSKKMNAQQLAAHKAEIARNEYLQSQADKQAAESNIHGVPDNWHTRVAGKDEEFFADLTFDFNHARDLMDPLQREVSNADIARYLKSLLNIGVTPNKVAEQLKKLAEIELFNHEMSTRSLNDNAGLIGMAYIEPNTYMDKESPTYMREGVPSKKSSADCVRQHKAFQRDGIKVRAKSVKQVSSCEGCTYFAKNGGQKQCNLYHLPIVGNKQELTQIINKMTAGVPTGSKRAALVQIANSEGRQVTIPKKSEMFSRVPAMPVYRSVEGAREDYKVSNKEFTAGHVEKLHIAGHSLEKIYCAAVKHSKIGSVKATKAVKEFIASLKTKGTKIALSQIDCTFLKNKLGVKNAIIGAEKCASCVYRQGMHCGLTGGTLLSFPGMDKQSSNYKVAADATDGRKMLADWELNTPVEAGDIDIHTPDRLNVQTTNPMGQDLYEDQEVQDFQAGGSCPSCGSTNTEIYEMPSMAGYGKDYSVKCLDCGHAETGNPITGGSETMDAQWPEGSEPGQNPGGQQ